MENFLEFISQLGTQIGLKLLLGLLILIVGLKLSKYVVKLVSKGKAFQKLDVSVQRFIASFTKVLLYAMVISTTFICWGVPSTSFMTLFASFGVAIGLALQGALGNFAGGLMILFFKPFKVGDYIESTDVSGVVTDITIIYTILTTPDNKVITVPNGTLTNSRVTNYSMKSTRRVDLVISADYDSDIDFVKEVLTKVAVSNDRVLQDPAPVIRLLKQNDSSLDFAFRVWVNSKDYWDVYFDMNENIKKAFDQNNITIPFPQVQISNRE